MRTAAARPPKPLPITKATGALGSVFRICWYVALRFDGINLLLIKKTLLPLSNYLLCRMSFNLKHITNSFVVVNSFTILEVILKKILIASLVVYSFHAWSADSTPIQASSKSASEILLPARNAIKAGNYEKAIELLTEADQKNQLIGTI
jgi:hypothetical protein